LSLATTPVAVRTAFAALVLGGFTTPSLRPSLNKLGGRWGADATSVSTGTSSSVSSTQGGGGGANFWIFFLTIGALGCGAGEVFVSGSAGGTEAC